MTSKERVTRALRRLPVDRVPVFMWFHPSTTRRLAQLLQIPPTYVGEAVGNDIRQTWVNNNYAMEGIVHENEGDTHTDFWGIRWVKEGEFNQIASFPLAEISPEELLHYSFPTDRVDFLVRLMEPVVTAARDYFIGVDVSPCVFEMYWRLRGMDRALLDMAEYPEIAAAFFERCADFAATLADETIKRYPIDWLWTGDDVAGQRGLIMSPQQWRDLIKPHLQRVVQEGKRRGLPVAYHCCGALREIIPDLIEIGVDVLNPVQCLCPGMDPVELKREFGKQLTFMGGVDTQRLLPEATAEEVRRATMELVEKMTSDGGGYILAATHTVPPETPDSNIFALFEGAGISQEEIFDKAAQIRQKLSRTDC
ncbi:MAG TPA: uroporphyrinogen decarboxylase family protein [Candidatus Hydrogenedentes bacterium]|nr:uroporphyrinogen decarboxylase family protein [Candidatus Hydrogenedentota bacterium]HOL76882.1 uroporphyrinogen decarboxylase family protein [Candidatus Hydrogenedentota bacterium]HPO85534.1 uroporphyrinogen decarboxylase family protein [Candidatus Hydrogenedentota bacterium]